LGTITLFQRRSLRTLPLFFRRLFGVFRFHNDFVGVYRPGEVLDLLLSQILVAEGEFVFNLIIARTPFRIETLIEV